MPHSMLVKLTHNDPCKRVNNPRVETLARIVRFFKQDGFEISINDLLTGFKPTAKRITITNQKIHTHKSFQTIPIFSMNNGIENNIDTIEVTLPNKTNCSFALLSDENIKPIFKKGSVFIVDNNLTPENDTLVAVKSNNNHKVFIRKLYIEGNKSILKSYDKDIPQIELSPSNNYQILGVIVHVNAKT